MLYYSAKNNLWTLVSLSLIIKEKTNDKFFQKALSKKKRNKHGAFLKAAGLLLMWCDKKGIENEVEFYGPTKKQIDRWQAIDFKSWVKFCFCIRHDFEVFNISRNFLVQCTWLVYTCDKQQRFSDLRYFDSVGKSIIQ